MNIEHCEQKLLHVIHHKESASLFMMFDGSNRFLLFIVESIIAKEEIQLLFNIEMKENC